jgi:tight adherence protein B
MTSHGALWTVWGIACVTAIAMIWWALRRRAARTRWTRLFDSAGHPRSTRSPAVGRLPMRSVAERLWRHRRAGRLGAIASAALGGGMGSIMAGPVAAGVLSAYGLAGFVVLRAGSVSRSRIRSERTAMDAVVALAGDLRAGMAVDEALREAYDAVQRAASMVLPHRGGNRTVLVARRIADAVAVSEASGAPLADVLERLDVHLRAADRGRALADAHAAGTRASAALLGVMPAAGIGLGVVMGLDPWRILLHTGLGAIALGTAVALQLGGVAWTARLARVEVPA